MWTGDATCGKKIAERGHWKAVYPNAPNIWDPKWHEIVPELAIDPEAPMEHMAFKAKPSGFYCSQLPDLLNYYRCDTVIVTGMVTSGCVRATVVDAFSYNFITIVPEECVADRVEISHKVSLFDMHMKYADVVSLNEVIQYIQETSPKGW
jgi:nicotinamidase-related amidase